MSWDFRFLFSLAYAPIAGLLGMAISHIAITRAYTPREAAILEMIVNSRWPMSPPEMTRLAKKSSAFRKDGRSLTTTCSGYWDFCWLAVCCSRYSMCSTGIKIHPYVRTAWERLTKQSRETAKVSDGATPKAKGTAMPMTTTSDVLRMLADGDYRIVRDFTRGRAILVVKDKQETEICQLPDAHFDNLCNQFYLERVGGEWRLTDAGKRAAARS
jgi:hypothetical protein